jgi:hypothetical protein
MNTIARAGPHASIPVHSDAVGAAFVDGTENAAIAHGAVGGDIEDPDVSG